MFLPMVYVALIPEGSVQPEAGDDVENTITESHIEITYKKNAILKNVNYKVTKTSLLAADHGAIILEGYHHVCDRLSRML